MNISKEDLAKINKLILYDIRNDLPGKLQKEFLEPTEREIEDLFILSSILSLSDESSKLILAYEIITKLFKKFHKKYSNLYSITHVILSRLGNFPNRDLLMKYGFNDSNLKQSPAIKLEVLAREVENSIQILDNNSLLTDFQKKLFDVLTKQKFYSISAPTSAGKSFVFTLSISQRLIQNKSEKIVLMVPTRALIRELSSSILKNLKEYRLINNVNIRTVPIIEQDSNEKGIIYVLTQERLNTLLNEEAIHIDTVFVDEAQEIGNNRGVVLQNTLELLLNRFPNINLFFASPLIENPNYFNQLLELDFQENYFLEEISPVGQNIIFLSSIKGQIKQSKVELLSNNKKFDLGILDLDFKFRGNERVISLAKFITKDDELTLVYCNGADDAEKKALKLSNEIDKVNDEDITDLIQFIKEDVHCDYSLIECLKKGVAYHYSYIPPTVRIEIEKLASSGKLKFIFCTSTLLQGVNLPTKNIILSNPSKGLGQPMKRSDFLNLIGRAGRLMQEFQGNIWCVDPKAWDEKSYEGNKLQKVESFYEKALSSSINDILELSNEQYSRNSDMVTVFGKFYVDTIVNKKGIDEFKNLQSFDKIREVYTLCLDYNIELPDDIIKKHYTIHPKRLNELYKFFKEEDNLKSWLPKKVFEEGTNKRLQKIFKKIDEVFLLRNNAQYKLFSIFASSWIHDKPLSQIIDETHKYKINKDPTITITINKSIRDVLKIIENQVRFEYVVFTGAYLDILKKVIVERGLNYDIDTIPNLPLHLECGSANPIVINLISLGLSRLTSIKLKNSNSLFCEDPTATNCFNELKKLNIDSLKIPLVCKYELKSLIE
jgi:replicative superfamily II helicase